MSNVFILGGEQTDFARNWSKEGKSFVGLLREVVEDGLSATELSYGDISNLNKDGRIAAFVGNFAGELYMKQGHLGAFLTELDSSFYGMPAARYEAACASGAVALDAARAQIASGAYDVAIVIGLELMKTVDSKACGDFLGTAAYYEYEAQGIDFPFPKLFGQLADVAIDKYKLDAERFMSNLAELAYKNYTNAKRNPKAQTRNWFMDRKQAMVRNSDTNALVGGRLAVSDCSQVTDGAVLVVLASERYASEYCNQRGLELGDIPFIKGWGHRVAPLRFEAKVAENADDPFILKWTRQTVIDACRRAKLAESDIDFYETHDCFTSSEYVAISSFGLTPPGREYEAIESGLITFEGSRPINPSGGLIGVGHPVGASGVRMFLDLYKQVSSKAGAYQIKKADSGMMLNIGGSATTNYVFIVGK